MPVITRLGTCVVASVLLLAGCGKTPDAGIPLGYAPADTPYVFGNIEPMPQAMIDRHAATSNRDRLKRPATPEMDTAATALPSWSKTGAATPTTFLSNPRRS